MIVPVFNYHLSIITIMGKNNKSLYISILSNFRYILKPIQNRLNRLVFVRKRSVHIDRRCPKSPYSHLWCENRTVLGHLPSFTNCKHSVTIPEYRPPLPFIFRYHIKDTERKFWCKCPFRLPLHQFYQKEYAVR